MFIFTQLINQMKIILDKKEGGVILFYDSDVKEVTTQRSPRETIWGFSFFQDKDALFKAKIAIKKGFIFLKTETSSTHQVEDVSFLRQERNK